MGRDVNMTTGDMVGELWKETVKPQFKISWLDTNQVLPECLQVTTELHLRPSAWLLSSLHKTRFRFSQL